MLHNPNFEAAVPEDAAVTGPARQNPRRVPRAFVLGLLLALGLWTAGAILLIG